MREPSSESLNPAEQFSVEPVTTPLLGPIDTPVEVGGVFDTVTLVEVELAVAPLPSITLAVQVMVSVPLIRDGSSCQVAPVLVAPPLADHV